MADKKNEKKSTTERIIEKVVLSEKDKALCEKQETHVLTRLAIFQSLNIEILKGKKAYGYYYAPLDIILPSISEAVALCGLGYSHKTYYDLELKSHMLRTIIFNKFKPEQFEECITLIDETVSLKGMNKFMIHGSALTYFRRYHIEVLFGLATNDDSDAGGASNINQVSNNSSKNPKGIDGAKQETDFVAVFKNLLDKNKSKDVVEKALKSYRAQINEAQIISIEAMIVDHFNIK